MEERRESNSDKLYSITKGLMLYAHNKIKKTEKRNLTAKSPRTPSSIPSDF